MTINVPSEIGVVLAELAAKLGVAAGELWSIIVRQEVVTGWCLLGGALLLLVGAAMCIVGMNRLPDGPILLHKEYNSEYDARPGMAFNWMSAAIVLFLVSGVVGFFGVRIVLNPAFYALNYLLGLLR